MRQLVGLGVTLAAVAVFSAYSLYQVRGLRRLQSDIVDRNRRDSLQLIRIQNDLNSVALALRDMTEGSEPYPITAYRSEFDRLQSDLTDALKTEAKLTPATRSADQQRLLTSTFDRFWNEMDELWALAGAGRENDARAMIRTRLDAERATMTTLTARLLIQNIEAEAEAFREIQSIYGSVERNTYLLLAAVFLTIGLTSFYVIRFNRRIFDQLSALSEQRKHLAGQVISVQEDVFRTLARELHDDMGQVLTALGVMLMRAEKKVPEDSPARGEIREVRQIANQTLERARSMSQMLHPPVLDDYGLEKSIEWYKDTFSKQTGLKIHYEKIGVAPWIGDQVAIHVYRILQEALNNVLKHAGTGEAWLTVKYDPRHVEMVVQDRGAGLPLQPSKNGIGLISMRERAELLQGHIEFERPAEGGTRISLTVPFQAGEPK
jgi:signal transduction histidine kinase